jgi:hypothetical protein
MAVPGKQTAVAAGRHDLEMKSNSKSVSPKSQDFPSSSSAIPLLH